MWHEAGESKGYLALQKEHGEVVALQVVREGQLLYWEEPVMGPWEGATGMGGGGRGIEGGGRRQGGGGRRGNIRRRRRRRKRRRNRRRREE